ncbi:MAG TPA: hypothetical protein VJN70_00930 [Gemmatimonadaceae bacterium]|nr:hypothetical protein [Gemmatimonadaceae bacterium]
MSGAPSGYANEITPGWFGRRFPRTYNEPSRQTRPHRAPAKIVPVTKQLDRSILSRFIARHSPAVST